MLYQGLVASPEEVESQERVFVTPFADGFTTFGGDETATGCPDYDVAICVVGNQEANEGNKGLVD